jgi:putative transposase
MDSVDTVTKSKKIEIFPTAAQQTILRRWFGTSRYVYNQAVSLLEATDTPTNFKQLVPVIFDELPDWHVETPRQIKVGAVMDACQAVRNAKVKCKQTGEFQRVKYRSKKNLRQMLYLRADSLKENGFYVRFLGEMKMAELLPAKPQSTGKVSERDTDAEVKDSQLVMENGRYFLCVPYVEKKKPRKPSGRIVALDPGVRDFMTFFSEDSFGWLGRQCINRIQRLCQHSDNLLSRATREQRPLRRALRKAAKSIKVKIRNLIDELHKKVAHFLVTNFDIILLPTFASQQMTKRGARKLRRKSVRQMLSLSHHRFKVFLKQKALEYGVIVIDVCEAYTSKTVSWTGEVVANLGGSKVIKSSEGQHMDRDLNGARGIFIKNVARALTVSPSA